MAFCECWIDGFCRNANSFKPVTGGGVVSETPLFAQNRAESDFLQTREMGVVDSQNCDSTRREHGLAVFAWTW